MQVMTKTVFILLIASVAMNALLWKGLSDRQANVAALEARVADADELKRRLQELEDNSRKSTNATGAIGDVREMARLRNEIGRLRAQLDSASKPTPVSTSWRRVPATADWSEKFAAVTNELARQEIYLDELSSNHNRLISSLATASVEEMDDLKRRAQSRQCIGNLKRIGLAARIWANDHGSKFPPDYMTMREELETPRILFCPAATGAAATDWSHLSPATVTYTWHGLTADEREPNATLAACPIHGHIGLADGSAQATRQDSFLP
jgi:hypothetical protein